jgi:hypothetical protein
MTQDPEIGALSASHPGWEIWRRPEDGVLCAWWVGAQHPEHGGLLVLRAATAAELRAAIEREARAAP